MVSFGLWSVRACVRERERERDRERERERERDAFVVLRQALRS